MRDSIEAERRNRGTAGSSGSSYRRTALPPYRRLVAVLALTMAATPVGAQVGHPPASSPYRDILHGTSWSLLVGHLGGDGGKIRVGPRNGATFGVRYDLRMSGLIQAGLSVSYMDLQRFIVDADDPPTANRTGPFDQSVVLLEAALQLNITGAKTWHGLTPFLTGGLGYALSSSTARDTSGYKFGNRFSVSPGIGMRYFLGSRVHIRLETRRHFWKLKYPAAYQDEPDDLPGTGEDSNAVIQDGKLDEWASGWWVIGGIGFSF